MSTTREQSFFSSSPSNSHWRTKGAIINPFFEGKRSPAISSRLSRGEKGFFSTIEFRDFSIFDFRFLIFDF